MNSPETFTLRPDYTHRANLRTSRYGWLRLTPSYSVHAIEDILSECEGPILDPFCGTGTTSLVCGLRGIESATVDINEFLVWLTKTKTAAYTDEDIRQFDLVSADIEKTSADTEEPSMWVPSIHKIEKWWEPNTIAQLSRVMERIRAQGAGPVGDLLRITFCRTLIELAKVSFRHQSMSFRTDAPALFADRAAAEEHFLAAWQPAAAIIAKTATQPVLIAPTVKCCDARTLSSEFAAGSFGAVITSPPYPNRMSYIRELRPYMYWLGFLSDGKEAGELDWQSIGGTWGSATSNVQKWVAPKGTTVPSKGFDDMLKEIAKKSPLLANYVHKYFLDIVQHVREVRKVVRRGGKVHYIIGNSKFYDVMVPSEKIYADLFWTYGFADVQVRTLRKRTSKKELYEYVVSGVRT